VQGVSLAAAKLDDAYLVGANLDGARLTLASLVDANLAYASLVGAYLANANLIGANLAHANLGDAYLAGAYLVDANLADASLIGARLNRVSLAYANLDSARLDPIREDVRALIDAAPTEAPALLAALRAGRVDGSCYEGECACLCGTIARARAGRVLHTYDDVSGVLGAALRPNRSRPAERWALAIRPGDTQWTSPIVALTEQWVEEWIAEQPVWSV
jgi:hypothetical protein